LNGGCSVSNYCSVVDFSFTLFSFSDFDFDFQKTMEMNLSLILIKELGILVYD